MIDILDLEFEIIIDILAIIFIPIVLIVDFLTINFKSGNGFGNNKEKSIITIMFLAFLSFCHALLQILKDSMHCLKENLTNKLPNLKRSDSKSSLLRPEVCIKKPRGNLFNSQFNLIQLK